MLRFFRKKLVTCIILILLFVTLKQKAPEFGNYIEKWITGSNDNRAVEVISDMYDALRGGAGISKAVEVLCDQLQNPYED